MVKAKSLKWYTHALSTASLTFCVRSPLPRAKSATLGQLLSMPTEPPAGSIHRKTVTPASMGEGSRLKLNVLRRSLHLRM